MMRDVLVKLTELLMFALPVSVLGVKHGASVPVALLILVSLLGLIFFRGKNILTSKDEKILLIVFLTFSLFSIFSWWLHGMEESGLKDIGEHARFMLFIPVYMWLRCAQPRPAFLLYGITIGAVLSLIIALYDVSILDEPRARGSNHPIMFADMAIALGFMAFAVKDVLPNKSLLWRVLPVLALIFSIAAGILSASRGAWIAIPALMVVLLISQWQFINARYKVAIIVCVFVLPVFLYFIPSAGVEERVNQGWSDIERYNAGQVVTSLGVRLESWKAAYYIALDHPLIGVGLGQYRQGAQALVDSGVVQKAATIYDHPHNDYFYHLSSNGLIGLFLFVMLLLYPLRLFYKHFFSDDVEIKAYSVAGMYLVIAFMHFSISETLMIRSAPVSFYGFFVFVLIALIYNRRQNNRRQSITTD